MKISKLRRMSLILAIFANFSFGAFSLAGGRSVNTFAAQSPDEIQSLAETQSPDEAAQFPAEAVAAFEDSVNNATYIDEEDVNAEKIRKDAQSFMTNFNKYYVHDDNLQRAVEQKRNYDEVSTILHDAGFSDNEDANADVITGLGKSVFDLSKERTINNIKFAAQAIARFLDSASVANLEDAITAAKYVQENATKNETANDKLAAKDDGVDADREKEGAEKQQDVEKVRSHAAEKAGSAKSEEPEEIEEIVEVVEIGDSEPKSKLRSTKNDEIGLKKEPAGFGNSTEKEDDGFEFDALKGMNLDKNDDTYHDEDDDMPDEKKEIKDRDFSRSDFLSSQNASFSVKMFSKTISGFVKKVDKYVSKLGFSLGDEIKDIIYDFDHITYRDIDVAFSCMRDIVNYLKVYKTFLDKHSKKRKNSIVKKLSAFVGNNLIPLFTEDGGENSFYSILKFIEEKGKSKSGNFGLMSTADYKIVKERLTKFKTKFLRENFWNKAPKIVRKKEKRRRKKRRVVKKKRIMVVDEAKRASEEKSKKLLDDRLAKVMSARKNKIEV